MQATPRRIAIVGATSSIAEHCARRWAESAPSEFVLVARDADRTERIATDLRVRGATLALGFAFAAQEVAKVPIEPTDQRLDAIVTETGLIPLQP